MSNQDPKRNFRPRIRKGIGQKIFMLAVILILFLFAIRLLGFSAREIGTPLARQLLSATSNPFIALFIGLLSTAIIQSSSTITSMTVALVGSGALTLEGAIPLVLGANIGTSLTSTLVALSHITNRSQFRRGFSAGTAHDLFNILGTLIFFPLEYYFGILSKPAGAISSLMTNETIQPLGPTGVFQYLVEQLSGGLLYLFADQAWFTLILSVFLIFGSIRAITRLIRELFIGESQQKLEGYFFGNATRSLGWGALLTAIVQSSSLTTSLTVPLVATSRIRLERAIPFLMGANLGTTVTALIAAFQNSQTATAIALVHVLFNLFTVFVFYPSFPTNRILLFLSDNLGKMVERERLLGFVYVLLVFFILPFILIWFSGQEIL